MAKTAVTTQKKRPGIVRFFSDITAELKKVTWLSRSQVAYLTGVVLIITAVAAVVLGFIDMGFSRLVSSVFGG